MVWWQGCAQSLAYKDLWNYVSFFSFIQTHKTVTETRFLLTLNKAEPYVSINRSISICVSGLFSVNAHTNWVARKSLESYFPSCYCSLELFIPPLSAYHLEGGALVERGPLVSLHQAVVVLFFYFSHRIMAHHSLSKFYCYSLRAE